jgi:peptidoglycan-N-acetylglucosamine deacetylase
MLAKKSRRYHEPRCAASVHLNSLSMLTQLASAGLITGLSAGGYAYAANWPTSQVFGRTILAGSDIQQVALTFDDGPNDPYTQRLLDLLARYRVRATFFLIGSFVRRRPEIARAILRGGHLLGNHTMTHPSLAWERPARVREELAGCSAAIEDATGERVKYFRPPFGARRPDVLRTVRELGLEPVMWNLTSRDWVATDPEALAATVQWAIQRNQRRNRASNILLHDGGHAHMGTDRSVTLAATEKLLQEWAGSKVSLVTVDAWQCG